MTKHQTSSLSSSAPDESTASEETLEERIAKAIEAEEGLELSDLRAGLREAVKYGWTGLGEDGFSSEAQPTQGSVPNKKDGSQESTHHD